MKSLRRQKRSDKRRRTRRRPLPPAQRGGNIKERTISCNIIKYQDLIKFYEDYSKPQPQKIEPKINLKNIEDCDKYNFDYSKSVFNPNARDEDVELPFFIKYDSDKTENYFYIQYISLDKFNNIIPTNILNINSREVNRYIKDYFLTKYHNDFFKKPIFNFLSDNKPIPYKLSILYDYSDILNNPIYNAFLWLAIIRNNKKNNRNIVFIYKSKPEDKEYLQNLIDNINNPPPLPPPPLPSPLPPPPQETFLPPAPPAPAPAQINTEKQLSEMAEKIDKLTETVEVLTKETEKNNENISNIGEVIKQTVLEPAPAPAPEPAPIIPNATANIPPPPPPPPTTQLTATTPIPIIPVTSPPPPPPPSQIIAPENGEYQYTITINNNTIGIQPNTIQLPDGTYIIRVTLAGNNISGQILQVVNAPKAPANIPLELEPGEYAFTVQNQVISTQTTPTAPDGSSYTINITIADNELGRKSITGQIEEGPPPPPTPAL